MAETTHDRIVRYLQDAVAAEHSFESRLKAFLEQTGSDSSAHAIFEQEATLARERFEQLVRRLQSLGAEPSVVQGFFAEVFHGGPRIARKAGDANEHLLQNLTVAYTNAHAERSMFYTLSNSAAIVGDDTTATLATDLQAKVEKAAERFWSEIEPATRDSAGTMPYASAQ